MRSKKELIGNLKRERWLYIMMIPGILYYLIFKYGPMFGLVMAFQNYMPAFGFLHSKWVGLAHFKRFFTEYTFTMLLRNTLVLGVLNLTVFFPVPIILALLLNEVRVIRFKRVAQTLLYVPHFLSWVVIASITYTFLTVDGGVVNGILTSLSKPTIRFLTTERFFRPIIMIQVIWREAGWGTIIFLAALAGIDPELYCAAEVDGANRFQRLLHITLPALRGTVITLLILRLGHFMDTGFEQLLLMMNPLNRRVAEVFDTYVYSQGVVGGQFSYTAAVGMFKSVASLILVVMANTVAKKVGEEGVY